MSRKTRIKACECAATALAGKDREEKYVPLAWALVVFFETYIENGAEGARKEFGPRKPVKIRAV